MLDLPPHHLAIALLQPQIAPNTGNIARLCVATGTALHLVRPLGFVLSDKNLRRSAMDYWPRLHLTIHESTDNFIQSMEGRRLWFFESAATQSFWDVRFGDKDVLIFGSETRGIDPAILGSCPERTVRLPQVAGERCLNLATSAGIAIYEAVRQVYNTPNPASNPLFRS
ncbi:MAG TPA: tRNA (cytidine(34)-2'-O)-methyltransferase [Tepidisphaeraceae bacterium]|jgi:tRNA (cytidine/uridine-2'-O-)-methyltransferase|nr:tRNA (cytidine(34)-2'-O)-methyltransferase [Tepidisphaeraceae bacterium]